MSDRPDRKEIIDALKAVIQSAEEEGKPPSRFAWHRRFVLGIDSTTETAERRLRPQNLSGDSVLDKAVEMTVSWLHARQQPEGSIDRAFMLGKAQELMEELPKGAP